MLVEKDIEERVAALLRARLPGVRVETSWGQVPEGEVKGVESPEDRVVIGVAVGAPVWDTYTVPSCSIPVALAVTVRRETAPDGAALAAVMEPIAAMVNALQLDVTTVADLSSDGFDANGVRVEGGSPPAYVASAGAWRITRSFTVRGVVLQQ